MYEVCQVIHLFLAGQFHVFVVPGEVKEIVSRVDARLLQICHPVVKQPKSLPPYLLP